jgi:hypothetical protein
MNGEIVKGQFGGKLPSGNDELDGEWTRPGINGRKKQEAAEGWAKLCVGGKNANGGKADNSCCLPPPLLGEYCMQYVCPIWSRSKTGKSKLSKKNLFFINS